MTVHNNSGQQGFALNIGSHLLDKQLNYMRLIITLALAFISFCVTGQTLCLDEIFMIRTMDSVELNKYSLNKGFKLKKKEEDNWIYSYSYYSATDHSIWFIRTFPKDTSAIRCVYYYFGDSKTRKDFKKQMKYMGFKFKRKIENDYGGKVITHNIYLTPSNEIDLGYEKFLGRTEKYFLLFYRRVN